MEKADCRLIKIAQAVMKDRGVSFPLKTAGTICTIVQHNNEEVWSTNYRPGKVFTRTETPHPSSIGISLSRSRLQTFLDAGKGPIADHGSDLRFFRRSL